MNNKVVKIAIVLLLAGLLLVLVLVFFKAAQKNMSKESLPSDAGEYVNVNLNEHAPKKILENNQLTGSIVQIFDPVSQENGERFVTIQADVIDSDKLKEIDFSKESNTLPMTRKEYKLRINNQTKFNQGAIKDLTTGKLIYVIVPNNIYSGNIFTATEISVLN